MYNLQALLSGLHMRLRFGVRQRRIGKFVDCIDLIITILAILCLSCIITMRCKSTFNIQDEITPQTKTISHVEKLRMQQHARKKLTRDYE